jgi:glycosyltransferase involved in cell wall biosynthesis
LWIRDDGSTDSTEEIVRGYRDSRIHYFVGPNVGARRSFFEAIALCTAEADFFSFSDHDDVWLTDKLMRSVEVIMRFNQERPAMACSRLTITDAQLIPTGETKLPRELSLRNALVETVTPGASILLNRRAFSLIRSKIPSSAVMHDAWAYLVVSAFGSIGFVESPTLLYRQHATNLVGTGRPFKRRWRARWQRVRRPSPYWVQAREFLQLFREQLSAGPLDTVVRYVGYRANWRSRIRFTLIPSVTCQSLRANLMLRMLLFLGKG